ncbi:hypothetical protein A2210_01800 [Candidatus Woesebacteria bacterium RIFOXYA1_FULL_40_18]|uniref:Uncharacterized protein n=2 Tax=Candidatus Woeseibacteriota TaxID=1752722 RepID=A0A1F8CLH3_9BACT|nr:MAG: hypothetical protein A2210_01800 [Candidatus Woesebacteria bacterium RIFOXYA1_FULL_40_18]OGM81110.1 MAG: hypothetical protein A2361_00715 [Candidatus Woesebacteria bacterium RIFOXYB1_FULL_40_26]
MKTSKIRHATENFVWRVFDELEKKIDKLDQKLDSKFDKVMEQLVDIAGQFKKFDEERVIMADRQRNHEDRIEKLEHTVFKTSQI